MGWAGRANRMDETPIYANAVEATIGAEEIILDFVFAKDDKTRQPLQRIVVGRQHARRLGELLIRMTQPLGPPPDAPAEQPTNPPAVAWTPPMKPA